MSSIYLLNRYKDVYNRSYQPNRRENNEDGSMVNPCVKYVVAVGSL